MNNNIAILADTHFGVGSDNKNMLQHMIDYFENQFFSELNNRGIKEIIHLGDFLDKRKLIAFTTLNEVKQQFLNKLVENDIHMHLILGNHDQPYKNTSAANSPELLLKEYENNVTIHTEPTDIIHNGVKIALIPWIHKENQKDIESFLKKTRASILCGHLEINGFEMNAGIKCEHGLNSKILENFDIVLSGHFHTRSCNNNIHYVGSPYQLTFADVGLKKGFGVLSLTQRNISFVNNTKDLYVKLIYDDKNNKYDFDKDDFSKYKNCYVKVIVTEKTNEQQFEDLLSRLENSGAITRIIETDSFDASLEEISADLTQDTLTIIHNSIDELSVLDKNELKIIMNEIYTEAINI